jgi:hypothetical protein
VLARHWPTILLLAIPVVVFAVPALTGHLVINDDDVTQNYPLRVLVGQQLRQGHLPLWNPYLWSGTPLLAGFNAGAAFPATWLFAVFPAKAAWVIDEIIVYAVASTGLYAFLRVNRLARVPSVLGALTFSYGGFMSSQLIHLDLVQGASLVPWALVGLHQVASASSRRVPWRWVVLLGASLGLMILAGSPEAMLDGAVAIGLYGLSLLWRRSHDRLAFLGHVALAVIGALALGAAQWLPGLAFAHQSQRAAYSYAFFSSGSMDPRLTILGLFPYLLGGYGRLGVAIYFGPFSLNEVGSYAGILALAGACGLLSRRWWRDGRASGWWIWYVVVGLGVVLAVGTYTPLGHLLAHLPFYGNQRLQSRNLLEVDLGLSVLLAFWLDRVMADPVGVRRSRVDRLLPALPSISIFVVFMVFMIYGERLERAFGASLTGPIVRHPLRVYMSVTLALAVAVAVVVVAYERIPRHRRLQLLSILVAADLLYFTADASWLQVATPPAYGADSPTADQVVAEVGSGSRFAVYNPQLLGYPDYIAHLAPDTNVLRQVPSVQGYGSLVSQPYQQATGAHDQAAIAPGVLRTAAFDRLNLGLLMALPVYFAHRAGSTGGPGALTTPPSYTSTGVGPPPAPPLPPLGPGQRRSWYLATTAQVRGASVGYAPASAPPTLRVGVISASGAVSFPEVTTTSGSPGRVDVRFARPRRAVGLVVENVAPFSLTLSAPTARTRDQGDLVLDGALQDDVKPPHWSYAGTIGTQAVFRNTRAKGWYWLASPSGGPAPGSVVRTAASSTGAETYEVRSSRPVLLVRSVAYDPGWTAEVTRLGSSAAARSAPVRDVSLLQGVEVPPGSYRVSFSYRPGRAYLGVGLSAVVTLGTALAALVWALRRRRRPGNELSASGRRLSSGRHDGRGRRSSATSPPTPRSGSP